MKKIIQIGLISLILIANFACLFEVKTVVAEYTNELYGIKNEDGTIDEYYNPQTEEIYNSGSVTAEQKAAASIVTRDAYDAFAEGNNDINNNNNVAENIDEGETGEQEENKDKTGGEGADPIELNIALPTEGGGSSNTIAVSGGAIGIMREYVGRIYIFGAGLVTVVAVLMIVIGGIEIMIMGGLESIESGKQRITQALIGIVLVILSALILHFINPSFFQL